MTRRPLESINQLLTLMAVTTITPKQPFDGTLLNVVLMDQFPVLPVLATVTGTQFAPSIQVTTALVPVASFSNRDSRTEFEPEYMPSFYEDGHDECPAEAFAMFQSA